MDARSHSAALSRAGPEHDGRGPRHAFPFRAELAALFVGGIVFAAVWRLSAPPPELLFSDFYQAYLSAARRLITFGSVVTWPLNETCTEGFVNIPVLGWLFAPLALVSSSAAAGLFTGLGVAMIIASLVALVRHFGLDHKQSAVLILLTLVNGPLVHGLREGNTTHMALALIVASLILMRKGYAVTAGAILGFCAILKLPLLMLSVALIVARQWRALTAFATMIVATCLASLVMFGPLINIAWLHYCVTPFLSGTMPGFNVQSLEAFLFRLMHGQEHLHTWYLLPTSAPVRVARTVTSAALAGGILWCLSFKRQAPESGAASRLARLDLNDFQLALTAGVVASPLSWSHYYVLLLLPWILHVSNQLPSSSDWACRRLMLGGIGLSSLPVLMLPMDLGVLAPVLSRTVVSACFLGGVLTFAALARGAWLARRDQADGILPRAPWVAAVTAALALRSSAASPSAALTRGLLYLLMASVLLGAVMWLVAPSAYSEVGLHHTWRFLKGASDDDSWGPMANALHYIENEYYPPVSSTPLYSALVFDIGDKYQYPPFALFIASALRDANDVLLPYFMTATAISWIAVWITATAVAAILEIGVRRTLLETRTDHLAVLRVPVAVALTLTFYPVVKAFTLGQIQAWLNAAIAVAVLAWLVGWKRLAGVLLAACTLIKPQYGLLLAWAIWRREWGFAVCGGLVVLAGTVFSVGILGWAHHADYLRLLSFLSQHGEAFYPNHSVNGLLNRLMSISDPLAYNNLFWSESTFPPYTWWIHGLTMAGAAAILGFALLGRRGKHDANGNLDFAVMIVAATISSPIAWEHHYGILMPVLALAAPLIAGSRKIAMWVCAAYLLASQYVPLTKLLATTPLNVLQSYLLLGAAIILVVLVKLRGRDAIRAPAA